MKRKEIAIVITFLLFYIYYQNIPHYANRYLYFTYTMVDNKAVNVDPYYNKIDDVAHCKGHYYPTCNPGLSFLAVPVYAVSKLFLPVLTKIEKNPHIINHFFINIFINNFLTCAMLIMFYRFLGRLGLDEKRKMLLTFSLGFGTIIFTYSLEYFASNTIGAFFAFSAFYLLLPESNNTGTYRSPRLWRLLLSGFCCGICLFIGYEYAFFIAVFFAYAASRLRFRSLACFASTASIGLILLMIYQKISFGGWFTTYMGYLTYPLSIFEAKKGFLGFSSFSYRIFYELMFGFWKGYFVFMPIMLLPLAGGAIYLLKKLARRDSRAAAPFFPNDSLRESFFAMALLTAYLVGFSCHSFWYGGTTFGPRYLTVTIPFFLFLSIYTFRYLPYSVLVSISGISIFVNWLGAQFRYQHKMNFGSYFVQFAQNGPTSAITRRLATDLGLPQPASVIAMNVFFLLFAAGLLWIVWKKYAASEQTLPR